MTNIREAHLREAAEAYAVANTPLYLIRKLKETSGVSEIARSFSAEEIFNAMRDALENASTELFEDAVRPYAYLIALSLKETNEYLKASLGIENVQRWDWFDYIRGVLVETYIPTSRQIVQAHPMQITNAAREVLSHAGSQRLILTA